MKTILIVDDDLAIVEMLAGVLEEEGYLCITAVDGEEGISMTTKEAPDLVITDIMMPRLDGRDMARALRRDPRTAAVPIVMMSAARGLASADRLGCDALVEKPFAIDLLLDIVSRLLDGGEGNGEGA